MNETIPAPKSAASWRSAIRRGMALAVVLVAGGLLFLLPQRTAEPPREPKIVKCLTNARRIAMACRLHAADHQGVFPDRLDELVPDYLSERSLLSSPLAPQPGEIDYLYFGAGHKDTDPAADILLRDRYTTQEGQRGAVQFDLTAVVENR